MTIIKTFFQKNQNRNRNLKNSSFPKQTKKKVSRFESYFDSFTIQNLYSLLPSNMSPLVGTKRYFLSLDILNCIKNFFKFLINNAHVYPKYLVLDFSTGGPWPNGNFLRSSPLTHFLVSVLPSAHSFFFLLPPLLHFPTLIVARNGLLFFHKFYRTHFPPP